MQGDECSSKVRLRLNVLQSLLNDSTKNTFWGNQGTNFPSLWLKTGEIITLVKRHFSSKETSHYSVDVVFPFWVQDFTTISLISLYLFENLLTFCFYRSLL